MIVKTDLNGHPIKLIGDPSTGYSLSVEQELFDIPVDAVIFSGVATSGSSTLLTDTNLSIPVNAFANKFIKFTSAKDYIRRITSNGSNSFTFPIAEPAVAAACQLFDGYDYAIGVNDISAGAAGNSVRVAVVAGVGNNVNLSAVLANSLITVTLGTTGAGVLDNAKNTADLVSAAIDALAGYTSVVLGTGSEPVLSFCNIAMSGGADAYGATAGTEYQIINLIESPAPVTLSGSNTGKEASDTINRGNDATPYLAGDVVSTIAGEVMEFATLGTAGQMIAVLATRMRIDLDAAVATGITGYRLHLYNAAPTAIADNAAFNIPAADRAKYVGWVEISTPTRFDDTQWSQDDSINRTFKLAGTSLFGILETLGAYTPTANAVKTIFLEVAGV